MSSSSKRPSRQKSQSSGKPAGGAARQSPKARPDGSRWYAEVVPGLEDVARAELARLGAAALHVAGGGLRFTATDMKRLRKASTVPAVYLSLTFDVPRPKALLGHADMTRLAEAVKLVAGEHGGGSELSGGPFDGLRLAAAGADSPVMKRLGEELARMVGLGFEQAEGELLVRLRSDPAGGGWEALVRLTPRPLSARRWRVCNRAGGLNACVAAAMNELVGSRRSDRYLNLMCGSGTLLVERALAGPARCLVGVDIDPAAVACAERNLGAAGVDDRCELTVADVGRLTPAQFAGAGPFDVITVDAPWGDAVGRHADNARLYPLLLDKAHELSAPHARFALLTHEVRLARRVAADQERWRLVRELQVAHGGHNPLLMLFELR